jgi:hypothetical protein
MRMSVARLVMLILALVFWATSRPSYGMLQPELGRFMQQDPMGYVDGLSRYETERSSPSCLRDPSGFVAVDSTNVVVECAPVKRGATLGMHCTIVASCKDQPALRFEDTGQETTRGDFNSRKKTSPIVDDKGVAHDDYLSNDAKYRGKWGEWVRYDVIRPKENCSCDIYNCLKEAMDKATFAAYHATGPNSNTFAHRLLNKCGMEIEPYYRITHETEGWRGIREQKTFMVQPFMAWAWSPHGDFEEPDYWGVLGDPSYWQYTWCK